MKFRLIIQDTTGKAYMGIWNIVDNEVKRTGYNNLMESMMNWSALTTIAIEIEAGTTMLFNPNQVMWIKIERDESNA